MNTTKNPKLKAVADVVAEGAKLPPEERRLLKRVCHAALPDEATGWEAPLDIPDRDALPPILQFLRNRRIDVAIRWEENRPAALRGVARGPELLTRLVGGAPGLSVDEHAALKRLMEAPGAIVAEQFDEAVMTRLDASLTARHGHELRVDLLPWGGRLVVTRAPGGAFVESLDATVSRLRFDVNGLVFALDTGEVLRGEARYEPSDSGWALLGELASRSSATKSRLGVHGRRHLPSKLGLDLERAFGDDVVLDRSSHETLELQIRNASPSPPPCFFFGRDRVWPVTGLYERTGATVRRRKMLVFLVLAVHHGDWVAKADLEQLLGIARSTLKRVLHEVVGDLGLSPSVLERHSEQQRVRLRLS